LEFLLLVEQEARAILVLQAVMAVAQLSEQALPQSQLLAALALLLLQPHRPSLPSLVVLAVPSPQADWSTAQALPEQLGQSYSYLHPSSQAAQEAPPILEAVA